MCLGTKSTNNVTICTHTVDIMYTDLGLRNIIAKHGALAHDVPLQLAIWYG